MSERNDGGPAFPVEMTHTADGAHGKQTGHTSGWEIGMSLRDYFAAKAMQGLVANDGGNEMSCEQTARIAYLIANHMLEEREK